MRRRHLLWVAWLAIGMSACTTFRPAQPETAQPCADWRWMGISRPGTQCPKIPGWTVQPLFPQLAPARLKSESSQGKDYCERMKSDKVPDPELIRELNRFCVYEAEQPKIFKQPQFPPAASAGLVRVDRDCAALSPADTEIDPKEWESNYKDFLSEAGQPETLPKTDHQPGVRLVFLDTEPTGEGLPERKRNSPHGYTLANIARDLVCTSKPFNHCAAQIATRLALPVIDFDPKRPKFNKVDTKLGGFLGMQSDLAVAIRDEVDSWREEGSAEHLVLNLSLAWDDKLFGGLGEEWVAEMQAGTQAVYRALQYAASFDVLVLAAAGNQKCAPCANTGPLLPAAWEKEAPREYGCEPQTKPLLYAVGGVDSDGFPLANARPGGMPRRVAYGETAVVTGVDPRTSKPTYSGRLYSGSSVSTAVVSSIAAVLWNSHHELQHPYEVMQRLDESGDVLNFQADFWWSDPTATRSVVRPMVHRLSLCSTLAEPQCAPWRPQPTIQRKYTTWSQGSCQPWAYPQPEDPPCVACIKPPPG